MLKIDFTEKNIDEVYQQFMDHPSGVTKKKLHVLYLKALGLAHKEIERIARTSADSVTRYLKDYNGGGLAALGVSRTPLSGQLIAALSGANKVALSKTTAPYCSRGIP
jgi:hypothetical protein